MKPIRPKFSHCYWFFPILCGLVLSAFGQGTISVSDTTGWNAWRNSSGAIMTDGRLDHQTGQATDDFVGDATYAGFQQKAGKLNNVDTVLFRARVDGWSNTANQWGNGGNLGIGLDLDGNGTVDLIMVYSEGSGNVTNRSRTITFGTPGSGANESPSTTTWSFPTQTAIQLTALTAGNSASATYSYAQATDGSNFGGNADAFVTFGISFANLENAIRQFAKPPAGQPANYWSNYVLTYDSRIAFLAYTSTQINALNQDLFGTSAGASSTTTWVSLGAITPPQDAYGVVPEPATYMQLGALLLAGAGIMWRRRKAKAAVVKDAAMAPASPAAKA